jgi:hypothetical protein
MQIRRVVIQKTKLLQCNYAAATLFGQSPNFDVLHIPRFKLAVLHDHLGQVRIHRSRDNVSNLLELAVHSEGRHGLWCLQVWAQAVSHQVEQSRLV